MEKVMHLGFSVCSGHLPHTAERWGEVWAYISWFSKIFLWTTGEHLFHKLVPEWSNDKPGDFFLHRAVVVVPSPGTGTDKGSVADPPRVSVVIGRARFYRHVVARETQRGIYPKRWRARDVVREDVGNVTCGPTVKNLRGIWFVLLEHISCAVLNAEYSRWRVAHSLGRENTIPTHHIEKTNLAAPKNKRETVASGIGKGGDTHCSREVYRSV